MHVDPRDDTDLRRQLTELLREHHDLSARLQQGVTYFRQLARSVWRVQEDERSRLARELHDGVGHNLTAMIHLVGNALDALAQGANVEGTNVESVRAELARVRTIAASTLQDTRAMSRMLRPQILDDLGLEPALRWLARSFSETHRIDVRLDYREPEQTLDRDRATLVFRIAQEALANVARHAQADQVDVTFDGRRGGQAWLSVRDNGRGADVTTALASASEGCSSGLGGMRDRVRLFGGALDIESSPGAGFCVSARFPLVDLSGGPPP